MSLRLYLDVHVRRAIAVGLRIRGVDVMTAQEDGSGRLLDSELLDRASALGRVLFSQDEDLLVEAASRQRRGQPFAGLIYSHQLRVSVGRCVAELELLAKLCEPQDLVGRVEYLPLR